MLRALARLAAIAFVTIAVPAAAQSLYMDTTGDGACTEPFEPLSLTETNVVDIWIDTSGATCSDGSPVTFNGYELVMQAEANGGGSVLNSWVNAIAGFTDLGTAQEGGVFRVGYVGGSTYLQPGKHKLGTLTFTYAGSCPSIGFRQLATVGGNEYATQLYTECPTADGDYRLFLGEGLEAGCRAGPVCSGVDETNWGAIKSLYPR
jgi:hypothetical protein